MRRCYHQSLRPLAAAVAGDGQKIGLPGCTTSCGDVSVPYPFGMEPGCSLGQSWFDLICNTSLTPPLLLMHRNNVTFMVLDISPDDSTVDLIDLEVESIEYDPFELPGIHFSRYRLEQWNLASTAGPQYGARVGDATCPQDLGTNACHSNHSTCQSTATAPCPNCNNSVNTYTCRCDDGYQGNAYLPDGCQGNKFAFVFCFVLIWIYHTVDQRGKSFANT